ncbi:MAG TPA: FecR family protein, partial [Polyangiaceae bacterium]|nr:FecR family protein [Polyangiaceae bacterium]
MAEPELIEPGTDELAALLEQARHAEAPALDGLKQLHMVRAALRERRPEPVRLAPRITRYVVGLAAALLMGLLGARAFEVAATRLATSHVEVGPGQRPVPLWLRTGDALVLAGGSALDVLSETSALRQVRLTRGAVLCDVRRLAQGQEFLVVTTHALVQVRGTVFSVQVDEQHTTVQVHEGTVQVSGRALHAGERWSSLSTAPRVEHRLFAAEVRAALAAREATPPRSEPLARVEPRLAPATTSAAPV